MKALLFEGQLSQLLRFLSEKPDKLTKAAKLLGGIQLNLGDASIKRHSFNLYSVEVRRVWSFRNHSMMNLQVIICQPKTWQVWAN
jgi:hypothetical protein